jgi:hypothetical protein
MGRSIFTARRTAIVLVALVLAFGGFSVATLPVSAQVNPVMTQTTTDGDGTTTTTTYRPNGSSTTTTSKKDGSSTTVDRGGGTTITIVRDANGAVTSVSKTP